MSVIDDDDPESQAVRRRTLLNDARVREQSRNGDTGTYLSHTHSELGGRFAIEEHQTITGVVSPAPPPLPANSPWSGTQPEPGIEPPLGVEINKLTPYELEPSMASSLPIEAQADDPANAPPARDKTASADSEVSEPAGSSPSTKESDCPSGSDGGFDDAA
jgi:hypothetical protein